MSSENSNDEDTVSFSSSSSNMSHDLSSVEKKNMTGFAYESEYNDSELNKIQPSRNSLGRF